MYIILKLYAIFLWIIYIHKKLITYITYKTEAYYTQITKKTSILYILLKNKSYVGIAPGAGEKNKIWSLEKYIELCNYLEGNNKIIVFFIGPDELYLKEKLKNLYPSSIFIEDHITGYQNIEIIMATTKYLQLAISNDSGVSHMLSTGHCSLIKLFGPKDSSKFTPENPNLFSISSSEYNSKNINKIPVSRVIQEIEQIMT